MSLVHPFIEEGWRIGRTVGLCFYFILLLSCCFPCKTMGFVKTYRRGFPLTFPGNLRGLVRLKAQEIGISPCLTFFIQEKLFLSLFTHSHCSCFLVFFLVTGFLLITGFYGPFRTFMKGKQV